MQEEADLFKISTNCVITLLPEKVQAFRDACRVLRPVGRLALSEGMLLGKVPERVKAAPRIHCGCIAGAMAPEALTPLLQEVALTGVPLETRPECRGIIKDWFARSGQEACVCSAPVRARTPHGCY